MGRLLDRRRVRRIVNLAWEVTVLRRVAVVMLFLPVALVPLANAKSKKKQVLPEYVLRAERVVVVIQPGAGEPLTNPTANRTAQENVEKAIMEWGRFHLVLEEESADLIIAVRKGHATGSTVGNSPVDKRPVIFEPTEGKVRVGVQQGRPPGIAGPEVGGQQSERPSIRNESGPSEDSFAVYEGGIKDPLDAAPAWRYSGIGALSAPKVEAVEQFRKAFAESEKQRAQKP